MFYSTDCNYIVKVNDGKTHYECYTTEQVKEHIKQPHGCRVYKVKKDGSLEFWCNILPYKY